MNPLPNMTGNRDPTSLDMDETPSPERGLLQAEGEAGNPVTLWSGVRSWYSNRRRSSFSANCITIVTVSSIIVTVVTFLTVIQRIASDAGECPP